MGVYTEFYIGDYMCCRSRGDVDPIIMTLFREKDKYSFIDQSEAEDHIHQYRNTAAIIRKRLDILGFTMKNIQNFFEEYQEKYINELEMYSNSEDSWNNNLLSINKKDFTEWLDCLKEIYKMNFSSKSSIKVMKNRNILFNHMISYEYDDFKFMFPVKDIRSLIRVFLEFTDDDILVYQDICDLIMSEVYNIDDKITEISNHKLTEFYPINSKILILTEGSSDSYYIKKTFELIYPEFIDYYYFMNFELLNSGVGVNNINTIVKGFIDSAIINRIIVLFDNDSAGNGAKIELERNKISSNVKIFTLPDLVNENICNYPVRNRDGSVSYININKLGCSIEMYLGIDCIMKGGELIHLIPTDNNKITETMQYNLSINKKYVQNKFDEKVSRISANDVDIELHHLEGMKLILDMIMNAFI